MATLQSEPSISKDMHNLNAFEAVACTANLGPEMQMRPSSDLTENYGLLLFAHHFQLFPVL